jgi:sensor histidine kinase YesM
VVAGVAAAWLLIAVVLGSQSALGMSLQGNPVALGASVRTSLINLLPWIPATLIVIAVVARFPVTRANWKRIIWLHLAMVPVVTWIANVGVVLGFWWLAGSFNGFVTLVERAAFWAAIRIHVGLTVYLVTATLTQGWLYFAGARERELRLARLETQLAQARFKTLSAQIRPHFLFNTLHTIGQLWRSGRADDADAMLDHLGSLFQRVRASTDRAEISLEAEASLVREYLAIEQARFPDRLKAQVELSADAGGCLVPPLLLQPLVENAIRHGISTLPGAGSVGVHGAVEGDRVVLEVSDDGPGMESVTPSPGSGTGLALTRERLEHAFNGTHAMTVESPAGGGTTIRIEIPARLEDDDPWGEGHD